MICNKCNANTPDNSVFCQHCGCRIGSTQVNNNYNRIYNPSVSHNQNFKQNKYVSIVVIFLSLFFIGFLAIGGLIFSIDFLYPTKMVESAKELNIEKVIELSAKGEELSWEDFDGYEYLLREARSHPNHQKREYTLRCSINEYDGIKVELEGDINKAPRDMNICFYETDFDSGFETCVIQADLRKPEEFEKILETYKEVTRNKTDGMMEYRYNFRNN